MKKNNEIFSEWLKNIPFGEYTEKTQQLAEYCGVSKSVITFWKNGRTQIKPAYQKLINEFACKKIFNQ
jgi:transcriptional regulator with XRE-family HTH domain